MSLLAKYVAEMHSASMNCICQLSLFCSLKQVWNCVCVLLQWLNFLAQTKLNSQLPALLGRRRGSGSADPGAAWEALALLPFARLLHSLASLLLLMERTDLSWINSRDDFSHSVFHLAVCITKKLPSLQFWELKYYPAKTKHDTLLIQSKTHYLFKEGFEVKIFSSYSSKDSFNQCWTVQFLA